MTAGRPSKYESRFCDMIVDAMATGKSITAFAAEIDVSRATINVWMEAHPEFLEAVNIAKAKCAAWWEEKGRKMAEFGGAPGQSTLVVFGLKNMGNDDWADVVKNEHSGPNGKPIPVAREMTDDELARIASISSARTTSEAES